ncbi:MAG: agmatine deiminase [Lachnospiraceae bacterium]|nr:agmatine deiminase [Lachnospiraceae bacterium]
MKLENRCPKADGFYMPAEFAPQRGCILIWPERPGSWPYGAVEARKTFTELILNLAKGEEVFVLANPEKVEEAKKQIFETATKWFAEEDRIHILEIPNNDAWARDTAPTFVTNGKEVRGISWTFNAWGGEFDGLYADWEKDNALAPAFCAKTGYDWYDEEPFVLEGGSIHSDGEGTVLVTEACLLSGGRNPSMTKEQITEKLKSTLGAEKVIWLPNGIYNDETNEHVDNVCAFTAPGEVVLAWTEDENDPQYQMSLEDLQVLERETDARGRAFKVRKILIPKEHVCINEYELAGLDAEEGEDERECGERLAASYVNFYIGNECVLVPQFGDVHDTLAIQTLAECFPDREIVPIQARSLIVGGGNIHCVTQQIPR